jgi:O-6-methylguanine DNA methyltransferase
MTEPLRRCLAGLAVPAPEGLVGSVLARIGLADLYARRPSPIGEVLVAFGGRGISALDIAADPGEFVSTTARRLGRPVLPATGIPESFTRRIDRAIATGSPGPLSIDLGGLTRFQRDVLAAAAGIPRGEVRSYGWVAREIRRPEAVRAVGSALARNPIPLVIPCHRVVRADGRIGRYSLGEPGDKQRLLEAEGVDTDRLRALARRGIRYLGSDTTRVFCTPTCRHARRITKQHLAEFTSAAAAREAGFRPCRDCRPAE